MWELDNKESWALKIDALWCWRRFLRVHWTARSYNQSILKKNSPEYSLEGLMLKLKLQYFGHLMWRADSFEKTLMLGKIDGGRRRGWQRIRWLDASPTQWTWVWVNSGSWWWTGRPGVLQSMRSQRVRHDWATQLNSNESSETEYVVYRSIVPIGPWKVVTMQMCGPQLPECGSLGMGLRNSFNKVSTGPDK